MLIQFQLQRRIYVELQYKRVKIIVRILNFERGNCCTYLGWWAFICRIQNTVRRTALLNLFSRCLWWWQKYQNKSGTIYSTIYRLLYGVWSLRLLISMMMSFKWAQKTFRNVGTFLKCPSVSLFSNPLNVL